MIKPIAKTGDTISWVFKDSLTIQKHLRGKKYSAKVAMVDVREKHYGVYTDYGQDLIGFNHATIEKINES